MMLVRMSIGNKSFLFSIIFVGLVLLLYHQIQISQINETKRALEASLDQLTLILEKQFEKREIKEKIIGGGAGGGAPIEVPNVNLSKRDDIVVIYNRVPKTGSTSFINIAYDLCKKNAFHVIHLNISSNMHTLSLPNQVKFVYNVTHWNSVKPALYHGHLAFINFQKFGVNLQPIWINLVRQPLDRLVSYYYFLRYGDDFRPYLVRRKHGDKVTFDDCVAANKPDCHPDNMWLQIPFFCGHAPACGEPGNEWALQQAKHNLANDYLLVGVTEQMGDFVQMLELVLPSMFDGAMKHYLNSEKSHLRKTVQKALPSEETVRKIQQSKVWQMENELYEFALAYFQFVKRRAFGSLQPNANASVAEKVQTFMYEKIRPK